MLPTQTDPRWALLVTGKIHHNFKAVAGGLMVSRLARKVNRDTSPASIQECVEEAYQYFTKFENVFADDLNKIFGT